MIDCQYSSLNVPKTVAYILGVINILQGLMASFGNLLFFVVVLRNRRLHTRSNACLISLATTDMLVGIILEPIHIIQLFGVEYRYDCKLNSARRWLTTFMICSSVGAVTVVSYDRYMHLSKTMNYLLFMTKRKIVVLLIASWLVPLTITLLHFLEELLSRVLTIAYIFTSFAIMITCYVTIIRITKNREDALKKSVLSMSASIIDMSIAKETKTHIRAAKAIGIIIALFFLTFAPWAIYIIVISVGEISHRKLYISYQAKEITYAVLATASMASSAINPIIYYLRIPKFKASFKRCARPFFAFSFAGTGSSNFGSSSKRSTNQRTSSTRRSTNTSTNQRSSSIRRDTKDRASSIRSDTKERANSIRRDTKELAASIWFGIKEETSSFKRDTKDRASSIRSDTKERASSIRRDTNEGTSSIRQNTNEGASSNRQDTNEGTSSIRRKTNEGTSSIRRNKNAGASSNRQDTNEGASSIGRNTNEGAGSNRRDTNAGASSNRQDTNEGASSIRRDTNEGAGSNRRDTNEGASSKTQDTNEVARSIRRDTNEGASPVRNDIKQTES